MSYQCADAARLLIRAFPVWGEPGPEDDPGAWISERLLEARTLSSTEEAVLHLAASLAGIGEYRCRVYGRSGDELVVRCHVPPLGDILTAGFDDRRRSYVLGALELATVGRRLAPSDPPGTPPEMTFAAPVQSLRP